MKKFTWKNKKVLLICRETYCKPLWFLAESLKEDNDVAAFFIMSSERNKTTEKRTGRLQKKQTEYQEDS